MAAIGSAVGLGNIWRFPYVAFRNGGGAFLIPYFIALVMIGIPLMILEQSMGQRHQSAAPLTYRRIKPAFEWFGWFSVVVVSFGIQLYYAVILAWCVNYFKLSATLGWGTNTGAFFENDFLHFTGASLHLGSLQWPIVSALALVWFINGWIVSRGISKGIEIANRLFMPLLFGLMIILVAWSLTLDGAWDGIRAYLTPDFSRLSETRIWQDAFGQIFFTLSLGFGIMIAYASYLPKTGVNIVTTSRFTCLANSGFEIFAGFAVFATLGFMAHQTGLPISEVAKGGPGLAFVTYPQVINQLPFGGPLFGAIFFLCLIMAGLTSLISINEALVSALMEKFGWKRQAIVIPLSLFAFIFGLIFTSEPGLAFIDIIDYFLNNFGLIFVGLAEAIVIGWIVGARGYADTIYQFSRSFSKRWWAFCLSVFIPIILGYLLIDTVIHNIQTPYSGYPWTMILIIGVGWIALAGLVALGITRRRYHHSHLTDHNPFSE